MSYQPGHLAKWESGDKDRILGDITNTHRGQENATCKVGEGGKKTQQGNNTGKRVRGCFLILAAE